MKLLKTIFSVLIVLIVVVVVIGLFLPTNYNIERSITIDAAPAEIHKYVGNLSNWNKWEPWRQADPSIVITPGEKTSGIGASQSWTGDSGDGALTFIKDSQTKGVEYDLVFDGGAYVSKSAITYDPLEDGETNVTWTMTGDMDAPVIGGYFVLMMDSMVGQMFEKGLENLKSTVEQQS
ncbi:MAG: SRPBCC family protein [Thermodesulfobacteriota bacterium]